MDSSKLLIVHCILSLASVFTFQGSFELEYLLIFLYSKDGRVLKALLASQE